jgi:hypothetical protein
MRGIRGLVVALVLLASGLLWPASAIAQDEGPLAPFAGKWVARSSMVLTVQADGYAEAEWRIYEWCGANVPLPCDDQRDGRIIPGGHAVILFSTVVGDTAIGSVRATSVPEYMDPTAGPTTFTRLPDELAVLQIGHADRLLCSERFDQTLAERYGYPC